MTMTDDMKLLKKVDVDKSSTAVINFFQTKATLSIGEIIRESSRIWSMMYPTINPLTYIVETSFVSVSTRVVLDFKQGKLQEGYKKPWVGVMPNVTVPTIIQERRWLLDNYQHSVKAGTMIRQGNRPAKLLEFGFVVQCKCHGIPENYCHNSIEESMIMSTKTAKKKKKKVEEEELDLDDELEEEEEDEFEEDEDFDEDDEEDEDEDLDEEDEEEEEEEEEVTVKAKKKTTAKKKKKSSGPPIPKEGSIAKTVLDAMTMETAATFAKVNAKVLKKHPDSAFNKGHYGYYINDFTKKGHDLNIKKEAKKGGQSKEQFQENMKKGKEKAAKAKTKTKK